MKKNKKESAKPKNENHFASMVFDCVLATILIVISFLDAFIFKIKLDNYLSLEKISSIVITLLPSIITIVSISLSISKEKIYGVTINEINSLRGSFYFNFLHMVLIMCSLIGAYSLLVVLGLTISVYCLEGISLIYSIFFAIQEIPLMLYSKKTVTRILKEHYLTKKSNNLFENEKSEIYNSIITNIILTEGLDATYKMLKELQMKETDIVNYTLSMQNKFFWSVERNMSFDKVSPLDSIMDVSLIKMIEQGYKNVEDACLNKAEGSLTKHEQIRNAIVALHDLCFCLNATKIEKDEIISLLSSFSLASGDSNSVSLATSVMVDVCCWTLNCGDVWFLELIRDNNWGSVFLFTFRQKPIGVFLSMIMTHIYYKSGLSSAEKGLIFKFINEPDAGINASGHDWKSNFKTALEFAAVDDIINSLSYFLKCYESVGEASFYFHGKVKNIVYDCKEDFEKGDIFHDWLLMVFYAKESKAILGEIDLNQILYSLNNDDKRILVNELSDNWLDFDNRENNTITLKKDINTSFLHMYSIETSPYLFNEKIQKSILDQLIKFHDDFCKRKENEKNISLNANLAEETKFLIEKFTKSVEKLPLFDKSVDLTKAEKKYFHITIQSNGLHNLLDICVDNIIRSIAFMVCNNIKIEIKPLYTSGYELSDENVNDIVNLKPDFTTFNYKIHSYISNNENDNTHRLKQLNIQSVANLCIDICWKNDALKFNVQLDEQNLFIRELNNNELESYINQNYQPFDNGLYRYNVYSNDKKNSFYVTKEELVNFIKKNILYVKIPFMYRCEIEKDKVLRFEENKNK